MGVLSWLGPLNFGSKRAPWDFGVPLPERKQYSWTQQDYGAALTIRTLVSGPGATEVLAAQRGGDGNSAVFACLQAICSAYVEAPLMVYRQTSPKDREPQFDSPLQTFLYDPNPDLDTLEILGWVQWAKHVDGNAYLRKIRSGNEETGNVVQVWPISPTRIEPRTTKDSGEFISFYRYYDRPGHHVDISPTNMIHFRMGIDDRDMRLGCSPLKKLLREIASDDSATRFADALLRNSAVPGLVVQMPGGDKAIPLTQAEAEELKHKVAAAYGGENAGRVGVLTAGATMQQLGFSPEQMDLKVLHRVPEERITAVMRVPAIVAGLGAGLDRSTFANFAEAREAFIENTILSLYRADDRKLSHSLVPDFSSDKRLIIAHDISQMRALQDDEDTKAVRLTTYLTAGALTVDEVRAEIGREPLPSAPISALPVAPPVTALPAPGATPLALRSRPPLHALPSPEMERKAADDIGPALGRQRDDHEPAWHEEVTTFFDGQGRRVRSRLRSTQDADALVPESEAAAFSDVLTPLLTTLLADVHSVVQAGLGVAFQLDDPLVRQFLADAGSQIGGITETTREAVRAALAEGQAAGEGIPQLAARLRDLPAFGQARAETVARTELGNSQGLAAIHTYRASGVVVGIRVHDGDGDSLCAGMNGRTFPLDAPPPALGHPRCVRSLAPIVDSSELSASA